MAPETVLAAMMPSRLATFNEAGARWPRKPTIVIPRDGLDCSLQ